MFTRYPNREVAIATSYGRYVIPTIDCSYSQKS